MRFLLLKNLNFPIKLLKILNKNKLALINSFLLLFNTFQLLDIRAKIAIIYNGLGDFIMMLAINMAGFADSIQELLDLFKGQGA